MEQSLFLEISATTPAVSGLVPQFENLGVEQQDTSTCPPTIRCERENCKKYVWQTSAKKVMARTANKTLREMHVCADFYNYYRAKPSTSSVNREDRFYPPICVTKTTIV